jgi:hypothetical protein
MRSFTTVSPVGSRQLVYDSPMVCYFFGDEEFLVFTDVPSMMQGIKVLQ